MNVISRVVLSATILACGCMLQADGNSAPAPAGPTNANVVAGGLYRTVVDESAGRYALVDSSKEIVTLFDKSNQVLWTTNVVAGLKESPVGGQRKISGMEVWKGELWVHVGKAYGVVDIKTGALKGFHRN